MSRPLIVVTVGTDHHRFDRLVHWIDRWASAHPAVDVFVQHGTAVAPEVADGSSLLEAADLGSRVAAATAVVTHGGPSSIMEARAAGFLPIVVARDPKRGEHVDGHQQAFTVQQERLGRVALVRTEDEFMVALDRALGDPEAFRHPVGAADVSVAVKAVGMLVDDLLDRRPARRRREAVQ